MFIIIFLLSTSFEYTSSLTVSGIGTRSLGFRNRLISTNTLEVVESVDNVSECLRHCLQEERCLSVFYRSTQRQCQLHDVVFLSPEDGVEDSGNEYYSFSSGSCPVGYVHARKFNLCLRPVLEKTGYNDIAVHCGSRGEHLIVIDSQDKQDFIQKQILASSGNIGHNYFIDGQYNHSTGQWTSHDGSNMTFFSWGDGLPVEPSTNAGVIVLKVISQPFFWTNNFSGPRKYFMCEKDI